MWISCHGSWDPVKHTIILKCQVSVFYVDICNRNVRLIWIGKEGECLVVRSADSQRFKNGWILIAPRLAELDSSCHLLLVSLLILTRPLDICLGASVLARPLGFMHLAAQPLARLLGLNCFGGCWYVWGSMSEWIKLGFKINSPSPPVRSYIELCYIFVSITMFLCI